ITRSIDSTLRSGQWRIRAHAAIGVWYRPWQWFCQRYDLKFTPLASGVDSLFRLVCKNGAISSSGSRCFLRAAPHSVLLRLEIEGPVLAPFAEKMLAVKRDFHNVRTKDVRYPRLFVARSRLHGLGLFAGEDIEWGRRLIEYQGQALSKKEAKRRQKFYDSIGFTCLMQFGD